MGKYDFIPAGKEEVGGKLVTKREDPYVIIQQLKAKISDLQRKIDENENAQLKDGNIDLRSSLGESAKKIEELTKEHEGLKLFLADVTKERDDLSAEHKMLRKQMKDSKDGLPPVTVDMEKMAHLEKENIDLKQQLTDIEEVNQSLKNEIAKGRKKGSPG